MQMLPTNVVVAAHEGARQQAPCVLNRIAVSAIVGNIPNVVIDGLVLPTLCPKLSVRRKAIAVQFGIFYIDPRFHDGRNCVAGQVLDVVRSDLAGIAFDNTDDRSFLLRAATAFPLPLSSGRASPPWQ